MLIKAEPFVEKGSFNSLLVTFSAGSLRWKNMVTSKLEFGFTVGICGDVNDASVILLSSVCMCTLRSRS